MFKVKLEGIDEMIANFKQIKTEYEEDLVKHFFNAAHHWMIGRANYYVQFSRIGAETIAQIKNGWQISEIKRVYGGYSTIITNVDDSAVYVEFGVGIVGQEKPHINASVERWEYNIGHSIDKGVKNDRRIGAPSGTWTFYQENPEEVDIAKGYITKEQDGFFTTRGQPAVMFLYKAAQDFKKVAKEIWEEMKQNYWGREIWT